MAAVRPLVALLLIAALLAGCSKPPAQDDQPSIQQLEQEANKVDLQATATTGVIRGIVVDEAVRPVAGANVTLTAGNKTTTSNDKGAFGFDGLEPGTYFLKVHKHGYADVQASAEVVPGVDSPSPVRVQLQAIKLATPAVEVRQIKMHLTGSGWIVSPAVSTGVTCCFVSQLGNETSWFYGFSLEGNGTRAVQVLVSWEAGQPGATNALVEASLLDNDKTIADNSTIGPSPAIINFDAEAINGHTAKPLSISGDVYAYPSDGTPVDAGVSASQDYNIFAIAFYNFDPPTDYRFDRDGTPVVPPA